MGTTQLFHNWEQPPLVGAGDHGGCGAEGVQEVRDQTHEAPVRPGLVLGITFQYLIDNEISWQQSSISVKDVFQHLLQTVTLGRHATVDTFTTTF